MILPLASATLRSMTLRPARQRLALKRLVRRRGLKIVAATLGIEPSTIAVYIAGQRPSSANQRRIDRAFSELGADLGLSAPSPPLPRRAFTRLPGEPHLRLIPDNDEEREP